MARTAREVVEDIVLQFQTETIPPFSVWERMVSALDAAGFVIAEKGDIERLKEICMDIVRLCQINALELRDLEYALQSARRQAATVAERMDPKRIEQY